MIHDRCSSTIIQKIEFDIRSLSASACAYFYFDFNDLTKQQTQNMIRSLIVQLLGKLSHTPDMLKRVYAQSQNGQRQPSAEDLEDVLHYLLSAYREVFIVLDALDECSDRDLLLDTIEKVRGWNFSGLHLLATSRKENDIDLVIQPLATHQVSIQNALVDADIQVYILDRLKNDPKLKKWPTSVQQEIQEALLKGAQGM